MARKLTLKQEAFRIAYLKTGRAAEAYRQSYDAKRMVNASVVTEARRLVDRLGLPRLSGPVIIEAEPPEPTFSSRDWIVAVAPVGPEEALATPAQSMEQLYPLAYYVYSLVDPRDGLPFYIGKGMLGSKRHQQHVQQWRSLSVRRKSNPAKLARIADIHASGREIGYAIGKPLTEPLAFAVERSLIKRYRATVTNMHPGHVTKLERAYGTVRRMLELFRTPTQWVEVIRQEDGRDPTVEEMNEYVRSFVWHTSAYRDLKERMMPAHARTGQPTA